MRLSNPRHEAFCQEYAACGNATEAAREVGYEYEHAANQGYRLLRRPDIQARLEEIKSEVEAWEAERDAERAARRARLATMRATEAETLLAKLDPVYEALLDKGEHDEVMKVIALQAEIAGHLGEAEDGAPRRRRRPRRASSRDDESLV